VKWRDPRRKLGDWSDYNGNEKEDHGNFGDRPDQWAVQSFEEPDEIVILVLLSGVPGMVLGIEALDAKHIIGGGDIGKQGCNDECDADNVEPAGLRCGNAGLRPRDMNRPGKGQSPWQQPSQV
jgi:hypothetical protein